MSNDDTLDHRASANDTSSPKVAPLAVASEILPASLYLLPVFDRPFFPVHAMPLVIDEAHWLETIMEVGKTPSHTLGLILVQADTTHAPGRESFHGVGTAVRMHEPARREGRIHFVAEGMQRFRIVKWLSSQAPYLVRVEYLHETAEEEADPEVKAYAMAIIGLIREMLPLNPLYNEQLKLFFERFTPNKPASLAYFAASLTSASGPELQKMLQTDSLRERMEMVLVLVKKELEVARIQAQISKQVETSMSEHQRKFFLREQLKVIQKELGISKDDREAEIDRLRERLEKLSLPAEAAKRTGEEMDKLAVLERGSPEYAVTRNYLDWMTGLPWGVHSEDHLDLTRARAVLDEDHTGLADVKDRIIEFLAVGKLRGAITGSILLLVGPPGVGKTSIGRSVATALGRKFYRFSVGGVRDEAEIKGHRRTYIGAMPGKLIQALKEVETANPVLMLDEVDKIGASYQGDPASALLEVLDPEQNVAFLDHYMDVRFDLSRVLFICTANQPDTIPAALLDRMEVIHLAGYITQEKLIIARQHLWPRQLANAGIGDRALGISDAGLQRVIDGYAREAGVRGLDKQLARIVRKAAVEFVTGKRRRLRIGPRNLQTFLGKPLFRPEKPMRGVGIVTGLAWTAMGGATLAVEATRLHAKTRAFRLTGRLGDVMKESAHIALSHVSSNAARYGAEETFFDRAAVHLHVPEGATPKDGPSAGITMATALLSLARREKIARALAMTGELTLSGRVLAVGGIREKIIAARRTQLSELILPEANRGDFEELPAYLREGLTVHFAGHYRDVVRMVFAAA